MYAKPIVDNFVYIINDVGHVYRVSSRVIFVHVCAITVMINSLHVCLKLILTGA